MQDFVFAFIQLHDFPSVSFLQTLGPFECQPGPPVCQLLPPFGVIHEVAKGAFPRTHRVADKGVRHITPVLTEGTHS